MELDYDKPGLEDVKPTKNLDTTNIFNGLFRVDFYENNYKVTVWNLTTTVTDYVYTESGTGIEKQIASPIEALLLRRNKRLPKKFLQHPRVKLSISLCPI